MSRIRILNVVGARPNFVKIAPLMAAYRRTEAIEPILLHTSQHRGDAMSDSFFRDLGIPEPDVRLPVAGEAPRSHAVQTADVMVAFERVVSEHRPDAVLVVGDVDSTLACALVAAKLRIPLVHVEAGLRSGDRTMPEEINRIVTDAVSDLLFCTEQAAVDNLAREGIDTGRIFLVGNVMVDALLAHRERAGASQVLETLGLAPRGYAVLTLHRPSNVDDRVVLVGILEAIERIQEELPVVAALHPRLRTALARSGLDRRLASMDRFMPIDPLGYLDFLKLMSGAQVVLTDSGGIQEETTILRVPCLTLRENTERPVTIEDGTNRLAGTDPARIVAAFRDVVSAPRPSRAPPLWDGRSADRIVAILAVKLQRPGAARPEIAPS